MKNKGSNLRVKNLKDLCYAKFEEEDNDIKYTFVAKLDRMKNAANQVNLQSDYEKSFRLLMNKN